MHIQYIRLLLVHNPTDHLNDGDRSVLLCACECFNTKISHTAKYPKNLFYGPINIRNSDLSGYFQVECRQKPDSR